jgi:hypothetical protein
VEAGLRFDSRQDGALRRAATLLDRSSDLREETGGTGRQMAACQGICMHPRRVSSSYSKGSPPIVAAVKASCIQLSKPEGQSVSSRAIESTEITYAAKTTL